MNRAIQQAFARMHASLEAGIVRHSVPGASVALTVGGTTGEAAAGVLNLDTGIAATSRSMFQIGSITKVFTASLIMRLVDEGLVDLDLPVQRYLPEFSLLDHRAASRISLRHLLTHSSGIPGDFMPDTGRGESALRSLVERCATLALIHPPGAAFSYCNTGYVIAGRVIEAVCGSSWDEAMRRRMFEPLGMHAAETLPELLVGKSTAMGHVPCTLQPLKLRALQSAYSLPFSLGPAGSTATMTATDLLQFAHMHMRAGRNEAGDPVLTPASVAEMQKIAIQLPGMVSWCEEQWGLGWSLHDWDGRPMLGHDGNTVGQRAFLRIEPQADAAMALLTNGGAGIDLAQELFNDLFAGCLGIAPLYPPGPQADVAVQPHRYTGRYLHEPGFTDIYVEERSLVMRSSDDATSAAQSWRLSPVVPDVFCCERPPDRTPWFVQFVDFDRNGRAGCLFALYRRCPRDPRDLE